MKYELNSIADESAIELAYLFILGRNPENRNAILIHESAKWSISDLRQQMMNSEEYKIKNEAKLEEEIINRYIKCRSEKKSNHTYTITNNSEQILVISNTDAYIYKQLSDITCYYNKLYAKKHDLEFRRFVGIKRGVYPHHAMYNKVHMLNELLDRRYHGWVIHIDADAIFSNPNFIIRNLLSNLRREKKFFVAHHVYPPGHIEYKWWNLNNGFFAIDLCSDIAKDVIRAWAGVYNDIYTNAHFEEATSWYKKIISDQHCLHKIFKEFDLEHIVTTGDIQSKAGFINQALRQQVNDIPTIDEMKERVNIIKEIGKEAYGVLPPD